MVYIYFLVGVLVASFAVAAPIKPDKVERIDLCASSLVRQAQTLNYSCSVILAKPVKSVPKRVSVPWGGSSREVVVQVGADGKTVTLSTAFDSTGIDFEVSKFNDDFFLIYNKVAHLVIAEALSSLKE